jgi:hypothetical protein
LDDEFGDGEVFFVWGCGRLSHCRLVVMVEK